MRNFLLIISFLVLSFSSNAKTWVINFGGTVGFKYDPDSIEVEIGDIINWQGDFMNHPLQSTEVPSGASAINVNTGTNFNYTITNLGKYRFICSIHGFKGVIIAKGTGSIKTDIISPLQLIKTQTILQIQGNNLSNIASIFLYDSKGNLVLQKNFKLEPELSFDMNLATSGIYYLNCIYTNSQLRRVKFYY